MSRVRLTKRAADGSIPYPGNVNQPGRKDPAMDEYHTFEQQVNHELPDMRHEWKDNERDDIGFGIPGEGSKAPTVASVRVAANKAVRIAVLLLGEKVEDEVIEAQARDLMTLSASAMDRTLGRFADTQKLYAEEEKVEEKDAKCAEDKKEEEKVEDKAEKKAEDKAEEKKEEKVEEKVEAKKAEDKMPDFIKEKIEKKEEKDDKKASRELAEGKKASDDKDEDDAKVEAKKAEDKAEEKSEEKEEKKASTDMDIELSAAADEEEEEMDAETAAQLASCFEGNDGRAATEDVEQKPDASKKAGIKKLGGQPRVAGTNGSNVADISSIWNTAPDVSELFR